ncbi:MAG: hypothetical protein CM15mV48_130 [uncultured marine virus]|nr:MAG: hypothetical protein CM15mV48_130 [uncultured marine virus]
MAEQGISINCEGGLDLVSSTSLLFRTPGVAQRLNNFESSIHGGYRRISGFSKFGSSQVSGSNQLEGIFRYAKGVVACASSNIFYSADGNSWTQVNKDTYQTKTGTVAVTSGSATITGSGTAFTTEFAIGDDILINGEQFLVLSIATDTSMTADGNFASSASSQAIKKNGATISQLNSASAVSRGSQSLCEFTVYESNKQYGKLYIADGENKIAELVIEITDAGVHTFSFKELNRSAPTDSSLVTIFGERLIVAGQSSNPQQVAYSTRLTPENFTGASAGTVDVGDQIVGIKSFRNKLIVFCKNSIYQLSNLDSTAVLSSVTKNIGCVSGKTIQEIGGDLIFLAPDGLRTIAGTARIDDIELGSISRKILPVFRDDVFPNLSTITFSSMVIREKSQYRLFYFKNGTTDLQQKGVLGTFKISSQGVPLYEWSQTTGIPARITHSGFDENDNEVHYHATTDGRVYNHDTGTSFDGSNIQCEYKTPDLDYGDSGVRKTLYYIKTSIRAEGANDNLKVLCRYDFDDNNVPQPTELAIGSLASPAVFGTAVFASAVFGQTLFPQQKINLTGSGFTNNFRISSNGTGSSYTVSGFYVDYIPGGRI